MRRSLIAAIALSACACGSSHAATSAPSSTPATIRATAVTSTTSVPSTAAPHPAIVPVATLPWIGTVVEPNTRAPFVHTLDATGVRDAPRCALADLSVKVSFGGAGGTEYAGIRVRNEAARPCFVQGSPYVAFLDGRHRILAAYPAHKRATDARVVLVASSWAELGITPISSDHCGGPSNDARSGITTGAVAFGFDADHTRVVRSDEDQASANGCPPEIFTRSYAGAFETIPDPSARPSFYDGLHDGVVLHGPTRIRRGETASYSVTFTNASLNIVPLVGDGCPLYRQSVGKTVSATLLLNCNGTGLIVAPNTTVRFEMRFAVPATQPLGPTTLRWQFVEPGQPASTAPVLVTA